MPEKSQQQWRAAIRRWSVVGAVLGLLAGLILPLSLGEGLTAIPGSIAFYVPLTVAMTLVLWGSTYRYEFAQVWGWRLMLLTFLIIGVAMAVGIGAGCLQGICGSTPSPR